MMNLVVFEWAGRNKWALPLSISMAIFLIFVGGVFGFFMLAFRKKTSMLREIQQGIVLFPEI
jgi:hypothetical protein